MPNDQTPQATTPEQKPTHVFIVEAIARTAAGSVSLYSQHFTGNGSDALLTAKGKFTEMISEAHPDCTYSRIQAHCVELRTGKTTLA